MDHLVWLLAQAPGGDPGGGNPLISMLIMLGCMLLIMYLLVWKPQQKRQKEHDELLGKVKQGDRIVTVGGIHGTVQQVREKTFLVRVAEKCVIEISRSSVATTVAAEGDSADQGDAKAS